MNKSLLICLFFPVLSYCQDSTRIISQEFFTIGKTLQIQSSVLKEERTLNVYLPASYGLDSLKSYPVIYLLDGSRDEDFIHVSGIVQFGSFSWINMLPESIVVGIGNVDRKRDFTYPSKNKLDQTEFPSSGGSAAFIDFLGTELQPFIEDHFRTTASRTVIGQSLGGLLLTEILFTKPELYDNYIIVSPSLWWDDERLLKEKALSFDRVSTIFVAGGKEGEVMERTAKDLYNKLEMAKKGNTKVFYEFLSDKTHGDALHKAVYNAFEKIHSKAQ